MFFFFPCLHPAQLGVGLGENGVWWLQYRCSHGLVGKELAHQGICLGVGVGNAELMIPIHTRQAVMEPIYLHVFICTVYQPSCPRHYVHKLTMPKLYVRITRIVRQSAVYRTDTGQ